MSATNAPLSHPITSDVPAGGTTAAADSAAPSTKARRSGQVLSGLAVLFLSFDAAMKLLLVPEAVSGTVELGYPASSLLPIGLIQHRSLAYSIMASGRRGSLEGAW